MFFSQNFSALFLQGFRPRPKKITPIIHAQSRQHSSPTLLFEASFLHADFLLAGDNNGSR